MTHDVFSTIRALVGDTLTPENLRFVDCFVHAWCGLFLPVGGNCGFAVTPEHTHPSYMFVIPYDAESTVHVEGRRIAARPGTLFCLSPGVPHHEVQDYLPPKYCAVCIEASRFERAYGLYADAAAEFRGDVVELRDSRLDALVRAFIVEAQNDHPSRETLLESLAQLLTHEIVRTVLGHPGAQTHLPQECKIDAAVRFVDAHYDEAITLREMARRAGLSESHFTKRFTRAVGMAPVAYLNRVRLENAKKMLGGGGLSVTEVARRSGFSSPSYFSKCFRARYNETPRSFMRRGR